MHYPSSRFSLFLRCIRVFFYLSFLSYFPSFSFTLSRLFYASTFFLHHSSTDFPTRFPFYLLPVYNIPLYASLIISIQSFSPSFDFSYNPSKVFRPDYDSVVSSFQILISNFIVSNIDGFSISIFQILNFPFVSIYKIIYLFL